MRSSWKSRYTRSWGASNAYPHRIAIERELVGRAGGVSHVRGGLPAGAPRVGMTRTWSGTSGVRLFSCSHERVCARARERVSTHVRSLAHTRTTHPFTSTPTQPHVTRRALVARNVAEKKRADDKTKKNLESVTRYCKICSTISTKLVRRGKLIFSCNVCACAISVKDESLKSCVEISLGAIHLNSILIFWRKKKTRGVLSMQFPSVISTFTTGKFGILLDWTIVCHRKKINSFLLFRISH